MLQEHLEDTYRYLFEAAHQALLAGASFAPFGAGIRTSGERIHANVDLAVDESQPEDHISGLIAFFRKDDEANGLMAAGLVFDGRMKQDDADHSKALCFHLEVANGYSIEVMAAYRRMEGGRVLFDNPQVTPIQPEIFNEVKAL